MSEKKQKVVLTSGCFDVFHAGHRHFLRAAAKFGDRIIVMVNSDASVKKLKGEGRPVDADGIRMSKVLDVVMRLPCSHDVFYDHHTDMVNALWKHQPDVFVKGAEYQEEGRMNPDELRACRELGIKLEFVPMRPGISSTKIIEGLKHVAHVPVSKMQPPFDWRGCGTFARDREGGFDPPEDVVRGWLLMTYQKKLDSLKARRKRLKRGMKRIQRKMDGLIDHMPPKGDA